MRTTLLPLLTILWLQGSMIFGRPMEEAKAVEQAVGGHRALDQPSCSTLSAKGTPDLEDINTSRSVPAMSPKSGMEEHEAFHGNSGDPKKPPINYPSWGEEEKKKKFDFKKTSKEAWNRFAKWVREWYHGPSLFARVIRVMARYLDPFKLSKNKAATTAKAESEKGPQVTSESEQAAKHVEKAENLAHDQSTPDNKLAQMDTSPELSKKKSAPQDNGSKANVPKVDNQQSEKKSTTDTSTERAASQDRETTNEDSKTATTTKGSGEQSPQTKSQDPSSNKSDKKGS